MESSVLSATASLTLNAHKFVNSIPDSLKRDAASQTSMVVESLCSFIALFIMSFGLSHLFNVLWLFFKYYTLYVKWLWDGKEAPSTEIDPLNPKSGETAAMKTRRRILTGIGCGIFGTTWVFSGNFLFTLLMLAQCVVAQLEYYRMCAFAGINAARRISIFCSIVLNFVACYQPLLHEIVLPLASTWIMLWFLLMRKQPGTISEIATSFMGLFYCAYLPSFWVRLRFLGKHQPVWTRFVALQKLKERYPWLPRIAPAPSLWTKGAVIVWWTFLSISFADIGAYFFGRAFGKRKFSSVQSFSNLGRTSPNKTVEGFMGGTLCSLLLSVLGAWLMAWPLWPISGSIYGVMLAYVSLLGDLTASTFKRDAGLKDSGKILPGHGGLLDRVDSYLFTAPSAYFFVVFILPLFSKVAELGLHKGLLIGLSSAAS